MASAPDVSSTVATLLADSKYEQRSALVDLASVDTCPQEEWEHVLPALAPSYRSIIGLFHCNHRGLRHEEPYLNLNLRIPSRFRDAVIVTSPALVEADLHVSSRSSTRELVGTLTRYLGCALLSPAILDRIVGQQGADRKPRFFALSNLAMRSAGDYWYLGDFMIERQAELVRGSFGDAVPGEHVLSVAPAAEGPDSHFASELFDELRQDFSDSFTRATVPAGVF